MTPVIDLFTPRDVAFAAELSARFGWTTSAGWFRVIAAHDPDGCFVARSGDRAIGMVTSTRYGSSAWVGNLMVSPHEGRLGLGTALLEHALDRLDRLGVAAVHLDGDRPGLRIYERHAFAVQFLSRRYRLVGACRCAAASAVSLTSDDLSAITSLDLESFGDDRSRLLRLLHAEAEAAFSVRRARRIAGYALLVPTTGGVHLGPWVAEDRSAAEQLLAAADLRRGGRTLTVAVPGPNLEAVALLESWDFEEMAASLRMTRGTPAQWGMPERIFGLGSGAIG